MPKFHCPKCSYEVEAIATQVAHRCPMNKSLMTEFVKVEDEYQLQLNIFETPFQAHSETSREAAISIKASTATLREQVLEAIRRHPSTDEGLSNRLALSPNTCRPRRVELVDRGLVVDSGRREKTASGRSAVVWIVKEGQ